jgi:hypothetical protein
MDVSADPLAFLLAAPFQGAERAGLEIAVEQGGFGNGILQIEDLLLEFDDGTAMVAVAAEKKAMARPKTWR